MKQYKLFILDLDGTMYRGKEKVEEAPLFLEQIRTAGIDYVFLTNNSTKKPEEVARHLATVGIQTEAERVISTCLACAEYIATRKQGAKVYVIGEEGLRSALEEVGCQLVEREENLYEVDYVVVGLDRQVTYDKFALASLAIRQGASFISTNPDKAFPSEKGLLPGNGSLTALIQTTTGVEPIFIGKPEPLMIQQLMQERGLKSTEVLMIGDNYETDIQAGIVAGIDTALVYTGYSTREQIKKVPLKPTYQWETLLEWQKDIIPFR